MAAADTAESDGQIPPPEEPLTEEAILAALTVLLLSDLSVEQMVPAAQALLAPLGVVADVVEGVVLLAAGRALLAPRGGPAVEYLSRTAAPRRAAYLVAAARRAQDAVESGMPTVARRAERRYLAQHLAGERARQESAGKVDVASARWGPVLGWVAKQPFDEATTRSCRMSHGKNFAADHPPTLAGTEEGAQIVAFPGQAHAGSCRCQAGPPWPGGEMLR